MEWLLLIAGIWVVGWLIDKLGSSSGYRSDSAATRRQSPPSTPTTAPPNTYRPRSSRRSSSPVKFKDATSTVGAGASGVSQSDLAGLRDAFTGALLNRELGLYRCQSCQVYYHSESYEVIRAENAGQCVACSSTTIVVISGSAAPGRNYSPDVITLESFRAHFGRVVTFEGRVLDVRVSRRGTDYAVMFENKSWMSGFKLVFFRGAVRRVGGSAYIQSLSGKTVRVRGLLINHSQWGPEIIISQRSMILEVK